jgi:hypothetical protein
MSQAAFWLAEPLSTVFRCSTFSGYRAPSAGHASSNSMAKQRSGSSPSSRHRRESSERFTLIRAPATRLLHTTWEHGPLSLRGIRNAGRRYCWCRNSRMDGRGLTPKCTHTCFARTAATALSWLSRPTSRWPEVGKPHFKVTPVIKLSQPPPSPRRPSQGPVTPSGMITDHHGQVVKLGKGSQAAPFAPGQKSTPSRP